MLRMWRSFCGSSGLVLFLQRCFCHLFILTCAWILVIFQFDSHPEVGNISFNNVAVYQILSVNWYVSACVCVALLLTLCIPLISPFSIWTSLTTSIMQKVIMSECTLRHGRPLCADGCSNEVSKPSWQAQTLPMQIKHWGKFIAPCSQIEYLSFWSLQLSLFF